LAGGLALGLVHSTSSVRAVAVAAICRPRRPRARSKKARKGPGVNVTFQAGSPSMCSVSEAPAFEI
jgi:hypothetical protein